MDWRPAAATSVLLIGGACAAWPFARTHVAENPQAEPAAEASIARLEIPSIAVEPQASPAIPAQDGAPLVPASWHRPVPIVLPVDPTLPKMSRSPTASDTMPERASHLRSPDFNAAENPPERPPLVIETPRRKHRIVDGDSLRLIALRYFGDETRAAEIAEMNRNIIADPALLPVGREILIPADGAATFPE